MNLIGQKPCYGIDSKESEAVKYYSTTITNPSSLIKKKKE